MLTLVPLLAWINLVPMRFRRISAALTYLVDPDKLFPK